MNGRRIPVEEGCLIWHPHSQLERFISTVRAAKNVDVIISPREIDVCFVRVEELKDVKLGRRGKLFSYTNCNFPPPGGNYKGSIPYGLALVVLDEGIIITSRLSETDSSKLKIGMPVELFLETLHKDRDGNEIIAFAYKPSA